MTLDEVKSYLRVDYTDDDIFISELIDISQIYIDGCVGEAYKTDDKLVKLANLVQKKLISDMYENRSPYFTEKMQKDRIVETILDKLSLAGGLI